MTSEKTIIAMLSDILLRLEVLETKLDALIPAPSLVDREEERKARLQRCLIET